MKKYIVLFIMGFLLSCSSDDVNPNCNFLFDVNVNLTVDLNLPQYSQLQFPGNALRDESQGNIGIILVRANNSTLLAWDGADPSRAPESCSRLDITGLTAISSCPEAVEYELITGQPLGENTQPCTLIAYRVEAIGNNRFLVTN